MADHTDNTVKHSSRGENDRIKYGASCMKGNRDSMEDAHTAILELDGSDSTSFFGVFDGHGGDKVALYSSKQLHIELLKDPYYDNNLPTAMRNVYSRIDGNLGRSDEWIKSLSPDEENTNKEKPNKGKLLSFLGACLCCLSRKSYIGPQGEGTTACVALIRGNQITVANAGDSRCVLSRNGQAIDLSTDHKPDNPDERARIEAAGGKVFRKLVPRVRGGRIVKEWEAHRLDGKIAISRALGDFKYKQDNRLPPEQQKMTSIPDIRIENITEDTDFLLIASDGIWHHKSSAQVVEKVCRILRSGEASLTHICERLLDWCMASNDNSTVILVQFKVDGRICSSASSLPQANDPAATANSSLSCSQPQANPTAFAGTNEGAKADTDNENKFVQGQNSGTAKDEIHAEE